VVRIVGLDQVKATALPRLASVAQKVLTPLQIRTRRAKRRSRRVASSKR
jgi:phenylalanyl-tRNA synthetase beta subunit (EC 6.1.1.20)